MFFRFRFLGVEFNIFSFMSNSLRISSSLLQSLIVSTRETISGNAGRPESLQQWLSETVKRFRRRTKRFKTSFTRLCSSSVPFRAPERFSSFSFFMFYLGTHHSATGCARHMTVGVPLVTYCVLVVIPGYGVSWAPDFSLSFAILYLLEGCSVR